MPSTLCRKGRDSVVQVYQLTGYCATDVVPGHCRARLTRDDAVTRRRG